ncbi:MAG: methylase domain protein [Acidobacteria bacterium]|nr:methylase domain protein [Acidobacteriota bacterium]
MPRRKRPTPTEAEFYKHPESESLLRPDVGTQAQFRKKKPPKTYRYDSSLAPELRWDAQNPAREEGEQRLATATDQLAEIRKKLSDAEIKKLIAENPDLSNEAVLRLIAGNLEAAEEALRELKAMSGPFLNWAGKAERLSFDVPTLPLFVHERLSTKAILETLKGHTRDRQADMFQLFGDPQHSVTDQILGAYEHTDKWVNRMILGDSLVVMNSLLRYEFLGEQVQMIYIDPPYGVKFGSNFQPFVRKREVTHNDDEDLTREPEMVQAYRDTWELGLHSYLTYLRDRLLISRELLASSGSIFVQISDENLHHVRELMDEIFGAENFCAIIAFAKTTGFEAKVISTAGDYLIWYAREKEQVKYNPLFVEAERTPGTGGYRWIQLPDGSTRALTAAELRGEAEIPEGTRLYSPDNLVAQGSASGTQPFSYQGKIYEPPSGSHWKANYPEGMNRLAEASRLHVSQNTLRFVRFADDFPWQDLNSLWSDTLTGQFTDPKIYVVQTNAKVVQRCILMTTDPGDLVVDPTCGSGTTAYIAEQWGRRWITIDTSRVPLALARQRLLTATFPFYELKEELRGPLGGFDYKRKQNKRGDEVGGIVPHITLGSIANSEPPKEEVLVDHPEVKSGVTRVSGPFWFEATIPTPVDWEGDGVEDSGVADDYGSFVERMLEVLRRSPVLRLEGNRTVAFKNVRPPAKTLSLSAEALVENGDEKPVAFVFGPENGAVSEKLVFEAAREAYAKSYTHLYVIGFAIQPNARTLVDNCAEVVGIPATYVQATPDLMMGDLLKHMRSSQIFSVCGLPEIKVHRQDSKEGPHQYQVELVGLDVFDPMTMEVDHEPGGDVPAWFLDTNYNELSFHVSQAFFPRTSAWDNLKRSLKGVYEDSVWEHLASNKSEPFEAGEHKQIAVKVIDDRGNELLVVEKLK